MWGGDVFCLKFYPACKASGFPHCLHSSKFFPYVLWSVLIESGKCFFQLLLCFSVFIHVGSFEHIWSGAERNMKNLTLNPEFLK